MNVTDPMFVKERKPQEGRGTVSQTLFQGVNETCCGLKIVSDSSMISKNGPNGSSWGVLTQNQSEAEHWGLEI